VKKINLKACAQKPKALEKYKIRNTCHGALISAKIWADPENSKLHIHIYFRTNPWNNCVL